MDDTDRGVTGKRLKISIINMFKKTKGKHEELDHVLLIHKKVIQLLF